GSRECRRRRAANGGRPRRCARREQASRAVPTARVVRFSPTRVASSGEQEYVRDRHPCSGTGLAFCTATRCDDMQRVTTASARVFAAIGGLLALCALALWPAEPHAQYFGRNKVLWEQFEFEILEIEHFLIHYYPPDAAHARYVARIAERWYARLSRFFDHELDEKKPLIIYANHADFQQTVVTPELIGEGTGGFTESMLDRVVLPLTGVNADNEHVIGHELVHVFQFDIAAKSRGGQGAGLSGLP